MQHPLPGPAEEDQLYDDEFYAERRLEFGLDDQTNLMRGLIHGRVQTMTELHGGPGSLLDVGAGTGLFVEASIRAGWRAVGVEISPAAVRIASKITRATIVHGRVEELSFDQRFDVVTLWDVLEHLPDPRSTLVRVRNLLRRSGLIGISMPNVGGMKSRVLGNRWRYYRREFGHLTHFSPETLRSLLEQAGFAPERVRTSGAFNLGKPFRLDAVAVREHHRSLTVLQDFADTTAGRLNLGEDLFAIARRTDP